MLVAVGRVVVTGNVVVSVTGLVLRQAETNSIINTQSPKIVLRIIYLHGQKRIKDLRFKMNFGDYTYNNLIGQAGMRFLFV